MPPQDLVDLFVGEHMWSAWIDIQKRYRNLTWGTPSQMAREDTVNTETR